MHKPATGFPPAYPLDLTVSGISDELSQRAAAIALDVLTKKLPPEVKQLTTGTKVIVGSGLIESGGQTSAEEKKIVLDADKNAMSLQAAEDFLIAEGILDKGDSTKALPATKNQGSSCLTYQLVHEVGHLVDGLSDGETYKRLSAELSPTKYGAANSSESFAEAFTYWVFGLDQATEAEQAVLMVID